MSLNDIAIKLYASFKKSGYSYSELSKLTGIPKSALQRYITGDTKKIPINKLQIICEKLDVDVKSVLGWDEVPDPDEIAENLREKDKPSPRIAILSHGVEKLTEEEQDRMLALLRLTFPGKFD